MPSYFLLPVKALLSPLSIKPLSNKPPFSSNNLKQILLSINPPFLNKKDFRVKCNNLLIALDVFHRNIANF